MSKIKSFASSLLSNLIPEIPKDSHVEEGKVWDAKKVEEATEALSKGRNYEMGSPFFEKRIGLKKENVVYKLSPSEIREFKRCKKDILYFAEKYCQIKTEDGHWKNFKLRKYQRKVLRQIVNNRFFIWVASRQIGKCLFPSVTITVKTPGGFIKSIPLYNLVNIAYGYSSNTNTYWRIKERLWKTYSRLTSKS